MEEQKQFERTRMYADERDNFMKFAMGMEALKASSKCLEKRLKVCNAWGKVRGAVGIISKTYEDIVGTITLDQAKTLIRNLDLMHWGYWVPSPMGQKNTKDDGYWMPEEALDELVTATKDHCMMCNKSLEDRRKCKLAKSLDLMPMERDDEDSNGCRYFNGLE